MLEHRSGQYPATRDRMPKLQCFTVVQTRNEAADLEVHLQRLGLTPEGRREINRWVVEFRHLIAELDYTPHTLVAVS